MTQTSKWAHATAALERASTVAVVGHINPDADAIGSVCATVAALQAMGKQAIGVIGQDEPFSPNMLHIPGAQHITCTTELPRVDLVITVDCGAPSRLGELKEQVLAHPGGVIVVDHHESNRGFGSINIVNTHAASTTALLAQWFQELGVCLNHNIAYALYAGLATDTAGFRWGDVSMHHLASELLAYDLDIEAISSRLFDGFSAQEIRMIGAVLSQLEVHQAGRYPVAVAVAPFATIKACSYAAVEKIADAIRGTSSAEVAVVLKEVAPAQWAISLRSHEINVAELAAGFSGGGHARAAGFVAQGSAENIQQQIIQAIASTYPS